MPKFVLQEIVSHYSRTPEKPAGIGLDDPFALPARIREIQVERPGTLSSSAASIQIDRVDRRSLFRPLSTPLQFLKGVGPRRAADLARAGLITVEDLLYRFPLRYEDRSRLQPIASLEPGQTALVAGRVLELRPAHDAASRLQDLRSAGQRRQRRDCARPGSISRSCATCSRAGSTSCCSARSRCAAPAACS